MQSDTAWLVRGGEDSPAHAYLCRSEDEVKTALLELLGEEDNDIYMAKFRDPDEWAGCELKWRDWEIGYVAITSFPAKIISAAPEAPRSEYDQAALDEASRELHMFFLREGSRYGTKACEEMGRLFMTAYLKAARSPRGKQ